MSQVLAGQFYGQGDITLTSQRVFQTGNTIGNYNRRIIGWKQRTPLIGKTVPFRRKWRPKLYRDRDEISGEFRVDEEESVLLSVQADAKRSRSEAGANETFKQLRQAVLSSLDFSDSPEIPQELDDLEYETSWEDIGAESVGSAAAVGKAMYEALRIDRAGKSRQVYVRRRDLIRRHNLQPRDLRRMDPSLSPTKTSPSITVKEECILINIGGLRAVISADRCLLFEPYSRASKKFVEIICPRLLSGAAARAQQQENGHLETVDPHRDRLLSSRRSYDAEQDGYQYTEFPFELEVLEAALMVATGKLEAELAAATRKVAGVLQKLPREITPKNLEELRRVKQLLVELESKAANIQELLEEIMDDDDEIRELNLSSRPIREEKRRQRERDRLEREMEREWAERNEMRLDDPEKSNGSRYETRVDTAVFPFSKSDVISSSQSWDLQRDDSRGNRASQHSTRAPSRQRWDREGNDDGDDGFQAQDALEELIEEEEEERELEETEDLLEYYLQRAAMTQSEAERLLAGARDLEESIGVSLSARRFEVNRLELLLSIASFAAALGAMVASIFGMNLRSTLEMSVIGFWGTTAMIVAGSAWVFWILYKYTKRKRIL